MSSATHAMINRAKSLHTPARPQTASGSTASFGGQTLPSHTQTAMSARFGHDFSQVRVHTNSRAGDTAHALGADAFTLGHDIVFGAGRYAPGSDDGDRLLAHELTHVVQQDRWGGPGSAGPVSRRGDASEQEAESLADRAVAGENVEATAAPDATVACFGGAVRSIASAVGSAVGTAIPGMGAQMEGLSGLGSLPGPIFPSLMDTIGNVLGPATGPPAGGSPQSAAELDAMTRQMDLIHSMMDGQHKASENINRFVPSL